MCQHVLLIQQPHNILRRRLLEVNLSHGKINNNHGVKQHQNNPCLTLRTVREEEDNDLIYVVGKVREAYFKENIKHLHLSRSGYFSLNLVRSKP